VREGLAAWGVGGLILGREKGGGREAGEDAKRSWLVSGVRGGRWGVPVVGKGRPRRGGGRDGLGSGGRGAGLTT